MMRLRGLEFLDRRILAAVRFTDVFGRAVTAPVAVRAEAGVPCASAGRPRVECRDGIFGMAMRVSDELMPKYMRLTTDLADDEIATLLDGPPRDAKLSIMVGNERNRVSRPAVATAPAPM